MHSSRLSPLLAFFAAGAVAAIASVSIAAPASAGAELAPVRPGIYAPVTLSADLKGLTGNERKMVSLLIDAAGIMDDLFWKQAYPGDRAALLAGLKDPAMRRFAEINYGPWDRLAGNAPFVLARAPSRRAPGSTRST